MFMLNSVNRVLRLRWRVSMMLTGVGVQELEAGSAAVDGEEGGAVG